jgi:hypothetical protein
MDLVAGLTAVSAALTTVKQMTEIDKALSIGELKLKLASLYGDLAEVRMALTDAREALSEKDRLIEALKATASPRGNYQMFEASPGVMVYASTGQDEPAHWACIPCLDRGKRSVLQNRGNADAQGRRHDHSVWRCDACKAELRIPYRRKPVSDPGVILD